MKTTSNFKDAVNYFKVDASAADISKNKEELIYCFENSRSLVDFDWWCHIQNLLGRKISHEEYEKVDANIEGDLLELNKSAIQKIERILSGK